MAIVQISRITQRKGLSENVPQLAGAEFGWAVDTRRLYIGNGTLAEGAPVIGNTEVLTEFSDVLELSQAYTYKDSTVGYTVQTGPTANDPVTRSIQEKLDDFVSVRDFGATGDGVTDDTLAINRALFQLYCRETNTQIRRSLFFPAGTYKISESIIIPPFAKLYGEGATSSVIFLDVSADYSTLNSYVARFGDSKQQIGANIGTNGGIPPSNIDISSMGFQTAQATDIFLVDQAKRCTFTNCSFTGPLNTEDLANVLTREDIACVRYNSSSALVCQKINFDQCQFSGTTYAVNTEEQVTGSSITNSRFAIHYQGIYLGGATPINGGASGFAIMHNIFDFIYEEGIYIDNVSNNASGFNIFYNVGNHYDGTGNPFTPVITFTDDYNVSVGDMFDRTDADNELEPRVESTGTLSTGLNATGLVIGSKNSLTGTSDTILNNASTTFLARFDTSITNSVEFEYNIVRSTSVRKGSITIISSGTISTDEEYTEVGTVGVTFSFSQVGDYLNISYTSTNTGTAGTIYYSFNYLA